MNLDPHGKIALTVSKPTRTSGPRGTWKKENARGNIVKITAESLMSKTAPMIIVQTIKLGTTEGAIKRGRTRTTTHHTEDLSLNIINKIRIGGNMIIEGTRKMIIPIADIAPR
jgi:hypothetical protein